MTGTVRADLMKSPPLSEADVLKQVKDWVERRGWRWYRMDAGGYTTPQAGYRPHGEPGVPDLCCFYYLGGGKSIVLWIEIKSPKDKGRCTCRPFNRKLCRSCGQKQWRKVEEARGALVWQVNDLRVFEESYGKTFGWLHGEHGPKPGQTLMQFAAGKEEESQ